MLNKTPYNINLTFYYNGCSRCTFFFFFFWIGGILNIVLDIRVGSMTMFQSECSSLVFTALSISLPQDLLSSMCSLTEGELHFQKPLSPKVKISSKKVTCSHHELCLFIFALPSHSRQLLHLERSHTFIF